MDSRIVAGSGSLMLIVLSVMAVAEVPVEDRNPLAAVDDEPPHGGSGDGIPETAAWLAAAQNAEPLSVVVDGHRFDVVLAVDEQLFAHAPAVLDGAGDPVDASGLVFLAGHVAGFPQDQVRLTLDGDRFWATFLDSPVGPFYMVPSDDEAVAATASTLQGMRGDGYGGPINEEHVGDHDVLGLEALAAFQSFSQQEEDAPDCLSAVPQPGDPAGLATGWPERTYDVAFAVDGLFTELHEDWAALVPHFVQVLDAIYDEQIDLRVSAVHIVVVPDEDLPSTSTSGTLVDLRAYYEANHMDLERESVYLFSAADFTNAAGQADCIGGAGYKNDGYAVGETEWGGPYSFTELVTLLPDKPAKIAAHELGHLLAAHHHHANCAEVAPRYDPFVTLDVCTVMINDWGLIHPTFSTLNKLVMRAHADEVGL